jgi:hypothetical protein
MKQLTLLIILLPLVIFSCAPTALVSVLTHQQQFGIHPKSSHSGFLNNFNP